MAAAMFSKMTGERIVRGELPTNIAKFGSDLKEIFYEMQDLRMIYGKETENIPAGAVGVFSYLSRIAFGLRLLMALNRKFSLSYIGREDLIPLTEASKKVLSEPWT